MLLINTSLTYIVSTSVHRFLVQLIIGKNSEVFDDIGDWVYSSSLPGSVIEDEKLDGSTLG